MSTYKAYKLRICPTDSQGFYHKINYYFYATAIFN